MYIGISSFRAFDRCLARLAAPISSGVRQGGAESAPPPPSGARSAEYPSGARVNSMGSLYNLSYFVKSWYFPLKIVPKQTNKSVPFPHWLKNATEIFLHSDQNLRGYPNDNCASPRWFSDWAQTSRIFIHRCSNDLFLAGQPMTSVIVFISLHIDRREVHILNRCHN